MTKGPTAGSTWSGIAIDQVVKEQGRLKWQPQWNVCTYANGGPASNKIGDWLPSYSRWDGKVEIIVDDLSCREVHELLSEHLRGMHRHSPPESVHALDLEGLQQPGITFWTIWETGELLGCGALKEL